jgi:hypothetical protein
MTSLTCPSMRNKFRYLQRKTRPRAINVEIARACSRLVRARASFCRHRWTCFVIANALHCVDAVRRFDELHVTRLTAALSLPVAVTSGPRLDTIELMRPPNKKKSRSGVRHAALHHLFSTSVSLFFGKCSVVVDQQQVVATES